MRTHFFPDKLFHQLDEDRQKRYRTKVMVVSSRGQWMGEFLHGQKIDHGLFEITKSRMLTKGRFADELGQVIVCLHIKKVCTSSSKHLFTVISSVISKHSFKHFIQIKENQRVSKGLKAFLNVLQIPSRVLLVWINVNRVGR